MQRTRPNSLAIPTSIAVVSSIVLVHYTIGFVGFIDGASRPFWEKDWRGLYTDQIDIVFVHFAVTLVIFRGNLSQLSKLVIFSGWFVAYAQLGGFLLLVRRLGGLRLW